MIAKYGFYTRPCHVGCFGTPLGAGSAFGNLSRDFGRGRFSTAIHLVLTYGQMLKYALAYWLI